MMSLNPLLLVGGVIGTVSVLLLIAYACVKDKKTAMGFERSMADGEILRRLFGYAKPYLRQFVVVGFLVLFSISYDIASPLIVGYIEELVVGDFELKSLYVSVAVYAGVLVFSMASTYLQAVILQRVGQRIISDLREDLFTHIESLSHGQLNDIPVGKLVTRVTNDTNAISMMFTNLFVNLTKNAFVILGILVAMLFLNYELTLMVLCFVPFILLFTVIFRKFSRRAYRKVKDATTDINTYLSENLSGIKVTQIFGREDEKMEEFRQKSQTLAKATQEQIFVFGVFRIVILFAVGGEFSRKVRHLNRHLSAGLRLALNAVLALFVVFGREDTVRHRDVVVECDAGDARRGLVRNQLEVIGLTADHGAERDQRVVFAGLRHLLQRKRDLESARHMADSNVLFRHTKALQLAEAVLILAPSCILVETGDNDANAKTLSIQVLGDFIDCHF